MLQVYNGCRRLSLTRAYAAMTTSTVNDVLTSSKAYVRSMADEDKMIISLAIGGKQNNLTREKTEPLEKALARLKARVCPPPKKDKKRKPLRESTVDVGPQEDLLVALYSDISACHPISPATPNEVAWSKGRILQVGSILFEVQYNPPAVDKLVVTRLAMVGYPLLPVVTVSNADEALSRHRWLKRRPGSDSWEDVGCSQPCYTPSSDDVGYILGIEVTPGRMQEGPQVGEEGSVVEGIAVLGETGEVQPGPSVRTAAEIRGPLLTTKSDQPQHFRVLTYNILADQYAASDYAQDVLFNYCKKCHLSPDYRKQLVLEELRRYQADVMCLQEVDEKLFHEFLTPYLKMYGYEGRYTNKMGKVREGSATFFLRSSYQMVAQRDVLLRECFALPMPPRHAQFQPMLEASPALAEALQKVTTIAQLTLLVACKEAGPCLHHPSDEHGGQGTPSEAEVGSREQLADERQGTAAGPAALCVVNTHLFFHPFAPHIRTLHTAAILEEVQGWLQECREDPGLSGHFPAEGPALLFCGDLNSDLNDGVPGVIELLQTGEVPSDHWDWEQGATFSWGKSEEEYHEGPTQPQEKPQQGHQDPTPSPAASAPTLAGPRAPSSSPNATGAPPFDGHDFISRDSAPKEVLPLVGMDVKVPFCLRSADDFQTPYTNYTSGYKALLDYVWYEPGKMEVCAVAPMPREEELSTFIPSEAFPSDHLAVICDLKWRR